MSQQEPQSVASIIAGFPAYAFNYVFGMALGILTDITTTSLALGSLFLGVAITPWIGLATFFLVHTIIKMVNAVSGALVRQGNLVGNSIMRHAGVFADQHSNPPSTEPSQPIGDGTPEG